MLGSVQRELLKDQVVQRLRVALARGHWRETLPAESVLTQELHVSRRTVRAAVEQLVRERWLAAGGRGRHHRILSGARRTARSPAATTVRFLSPRPRSDNDHAIQVVENALRERLGAAGFQLQYECHPDVYRRFSEKRMRAVALQPDTAAWVLLHTTRPIQEWFARSGLPGVVSGSCHDDVNLPSVEFDYQASCFHAANLLLGKGHRHLACVAPRKLNASEQSAVNGFFAAVHRQANAQASITAHDGSRADICRSLTKLLRLSPPPTGYLAMLPEHALTILGFLQSQHWRVPGNAALICRSHDIVLNYVVPSVAHYQIDCVKNGYKTADLLVDIIRHGRGKPRHIKIMPEFVPGDTLAPIKMRFTTGSVTLSSCSLDSESV